MRRSLKYQYTFDGIKQDIVLDSLKQATCTYSKGCAKLRAKVNVIRNKKQLTGTEVLSYTVTIILPTVLPVSNC